MPSLKNAWKKICPGITVLYFISIFIFKGNHSCAPNAEVTFPYNDSTLVLEALQDIQEGEVE
jgi:hypothetical protein